MDMDKDMCMGMGMGMGMGMEMLVMSPATGSEAAAATVVATASEDEGDLRRGSWTVEEDMLLVDYIAKHGEGRWNSLARFTGLRRTGKSCRLRWLNYLRPDVRRGNITPEEQLLILELHSRWGNRWSKIAQHLPGRTDNEIKNYWRTRVQKHARQLKCDVNSNQFRDVVRFVWMPRLLERMHAGSAATGDVTTTTRTAMSSPAGDARCSDDVATTDVDRAEPRRVVDHASSSQAARMVATVNTSPDTTSTLRSSSSMGACFTQWGAATGATTHDVDGTVAQCAGGEGRATGDDHVIHDDELSGSWSELLATTGLPDFEFGEFDDNLWSLEDVYLRNFPKEK